MTEEDVWRGLRVNYLLLLLDQLLQRAPDSIELLRCLSDSYIETLESLLDDYERT